MTSPLLEVHALEKNYGATRALAGVSLHVNRGEVLALLGHNGSGKSTLVKSLAGVITPDAGTITTHGASLHIIHQTLGLVDSLSATENIDLTRRHGTRALAPLRPRTERADVARLVARFGTQFDPSVPVGQLTAAERTIVAIVRALDGWDEGAHVLVLDEPTATLHDEEAAILLAAVRSIAAEGVGVIYISHRLSEIAEIADRVLVLRNGSVAAEFDHDDYDTDVLLAVITGDTHAASGQRAPQASSEALLQVDSLGGAGVSEVSFTAHAGEVLGIAGVIGSGMEQLNSLIFGALPAGSGQVRVAGELLRRGSPRAAVNMGVGFLPADRLVAGGIAGHSVRENFTLPFLRPFRRWHGGLDVRRETTETEKWMATVHAMPSHAAPLELRMLSGGNQQKILLAKWLRLKPRVLLLDEPTQGVDVGAQSEIYALLRTTAEQGAAIVIASSDTHELVRVCDRILVFQDGRISAELRGAEITETAVVHSVLDDRSPATATIRKAS